MWKTLSSRVVYQNPWIKVREDEVIAPTGKVGIYGVVEPTLALGIVAITYHESEPKVLMVGQYRYPLGTYSVEIPEGGKKEDETPEEGIARECVEETGYYPKKLIRLGEVVHTSNCFTNESARLFFSDDLEFRGKQGEDSTELIDVKLYTIREVKEKLASGFITDAMSIIALYRAIALME